MAKGGARLGGVTSSLNMLPSLDSQLIDLWRERAQLTVRGGRNAGWPAGVPHLRLAEDMLACP